jgi:large subunit ribosomal protein L11
MSVNLVKKVRLRIDAGAAKPGPAIGQALGPLGLNMAEFCKQFNDATKHYEQGVPLPVVLSAFSNRTFTFQLKTPPTTWFLKRVTGMKKAASRPGHETVAKIHVKHVYEIAKIKQTDEHLQDINLDNLCRQIVGSCKSMGIEVVGGDEDNEKKT